ncbi:MAG: major facilitator superfamily domain-containing protein 1 [bacterium]|nr:major facilitator superfamily domain-containing protein 1 [bacterium]
MTISEQKQRELKKAAVIFAYVALFVVSIAAMTTYFSTDLIRPLVTEFKENLGYSTAQVNLLSSIYSLPPIIFLFFSGIITDKIGIKKSSLGLMGLVAVGSYLMTFLDYDMILIGRLLIGLGAESFFVVMNKIVTKWFKDKQLAMAFGLNLLLCRLGSIAAFNLLPWIVKSYSLKTALWMGAGITIAGFFLTILYCLVDKHGDEKGYVSVLEDQADEPFSVRDALRLPKAFWAITLLCVTYYSTIFPFTGVAKDLFVEKEKVKQVAALEEKGMPAAVSKKIFEFINDENTLKDKTKVENAAAGLKESKCFSSVSIDFDEKDSIYALRLEYESNGKVVKKSINRDFLAGPEYTKLNETKISGARLTSLILIISMCVTWLFGLLIDKIGKRATIMIIGSIIMIPCHVSLAYTDIPNAIPMIILGLSFALVPAALWPAVPLIVKEKNLGTAYGIIFMIQNIGLFVFEPLAGKLFDMTGNYKMSMVMFSTLGVVGLLFAIWLKIIEKKGGGYLDTAKAKIL